MTATGRAALTGRPAREVLAACRAALDPTMRAAVDMLPGSMRHIAGYHFGWWDRHGNPANGAAGKGLRPAIVLLAADAVDGIQSAALPAAVAVELVHNFSLVHDDVMDSDATRHHRPTVWKAFGVSAAILSGDALLALALDVVAASGHSESKSGLRMLTAAVQDLTEGQSADVEFERRSDVELAECERMTAHKTGALLACAAGLGALFGGAAPARVDRLRAFGLHLGLAFQHADDLIGIWGEEAVTGKPIHSDLRNRKKTLPVVSALNSATRAGRELSALYHLGKPLSDKDIARAAELVELAGGRAFSQAQADVQLSRALRELAAAEPAARPGAELAALARLATHRDR